MFFGIFMFLCDFSWLSCLLLPAERKYSFFRKLSSRLVNAISKSIKTDFYTFLRCLKSSLLLWNTKVVKKQYFYVFYLNRSAYWFFDTKNLENMYFLCFFSHNIHLLTLKLLFKIVKHAKPATTEASRNVFFLWGMSWAALPTVFFIWSALPTVFLRQNLKNMWFLCLFSQQ